MNPWLSPVFQDGGQVKLPTSGYEEVVKIPTQVEPHDVKFPWVARPSTPVLNIDMCIRVAMFVLGRCQTTCVNTPSRATAVHCNTFSIYM